MVLNPERTRLSHPAEHEEKADHIAALIHESGLDAEYQQELFGLLRGLEETSETFYLQTESEVKHAIAQLFDSAQGFVSIAALYDFVLRNREKLETIEDEIARRIQNEERITLTLLAFLGKVSDLRKTKKIQNSLVKAFKRLSDRVTVEGIRRQDEEMQVQPDDPMFEHYPELAENIQKARKSRIDRVENLRTTPFITHGLGKQLALLSRMSDPHSNALSHVIFDFIDAYGETIRGYHYVNPDFADYSDVDCFYNEFLRTTDPLLYENYLVGEHRAHLSDMHTSRDFIPDADLVWDENSDMDPSFTYARRYGIRHDFERQKNAYLVGQEFSNDTPLFAIAPGYVGKYENGRLAFVYKITLRDQEAWAHAMQEARTANNGRDAKLLEYAQDEKEYLLEYEVERLLQESDPLFIDPDLPAIKKLSGRLRQAIILNNEEVFDRCSIDRPAPKKSIPHDDYFKLLFPAGSEMRFEEIQEYIYFTSLQSRESSERDFSLRLSDHLPWVQHNFLRFLDSYPMIKKDWVHEDIETRTRDALVVRDDGSTGEESDFYKRKTAELANPGFQRFEQFQAFAKTFGEDGLKTLVSVNNDPDFYTTIVRIATDLHNDEAKKVFAVYAKFADSAYAAGDYVRKHFTALSDYRDEVVDEIIESLLARGKEALIDLSGQIDNAQFSTILEQLGRMRKDVILFTGCFYQLKKSREHVSFSEIKDVEFFSLSSEQLTVEEKRKIRRIAEQNYPQGNDPDKEYSADFRAELLAALESSFADPSSVFYLLKHKNGDIISFYRFRDESTGSQKKVRAGLFNVNPAYRGSKIGEAMQEHTADEYVRKGYLIVSRCEALKLIAQYYIEHGRIATRFYNNKGVPTLDLERDTATGQYASKKKIKQSEIIRMYEEDIPSDSDMKILRFDGDPDFSLLDQGYVLTRWIQKGKRKYCVFELSY